MAGKAYIGKEMDQRTNKSIRAFVLAVSKQSPGLVSAYLFGSFARHTEKPTSDIDIALVFQNLGEAERFDLQVELMMLASQFDSRIEPHPLSTEDFGSGSAFAHEIRSTGIKIEVPKKSRSS